MRRGYFIALLAIGLILPLTAFAAGAVGEPSPREQTARIWIKSGARRDITPPVDVMWAPNARWQIVAARTTAAEFPPGNIELAKDADLKAAFREMNRRKIALALGTGLLTRSDRCRAHNEATASPGELERMLQKIRRDGGNLRYIAMDEPYYFGSVDASGCHQSLTELAVEVAASVSAARRIFPRLQIGDIEVLNASHPMTQQIVAWADAYRTATGERLAFMQTDIAWSESAMRNLRPLADALHRRGIPLAIIYNADADAHTDESWQQSAESHITEIETALRIHPDIAVFDSWTKNPTHRLPETTPGTLTNIALRYLRPVSTLRLARRGRVVMGRLMDAQGRPIAGARITISAVDVGARIRPVMRSLSGTVPQGAGSAIIGIRVGSEGSCVCNGEARAVIGGIHYQEKGRGKQVIVSPVSLPIEGAPARLRTLELIPGTIFSPNLKRFPVTPGAQYTLEEPISATAAADHAGYATVIFLDASGKGISRAFLWFGPSRLDLGAVTTTADGRFTLVLAETVAFARPEIQASFAGNAGLRGALAISDPPQSGEAVLSGPGAAACAPHPPHPAAREIWLAPQGLDPTRQSAVDFAELFKPGAPWKVAAAHTQVFKFYSGYLLHAPQAEIDTDVADLNRRGIAIAIETGVMNVAPNPATGCGGLGNVEGYGTVLRANRIAQIIKAAHGEIRFIDMDEPFYYGHIYTHFAGKGQGCHSPVAEVLRLSKPTLDAFIQQFPNVVIGDSEPTLFAGTDPRWRADLTEWVAGFKATMGRPLAFYDLDVEWPRGTQEPDAIYHFAQTLRARRLIGQIGVIYDGTPQDHTDEAWVGDAERHIRLVEDQLGWRPDRAIIQSWQPNPTHALPETAADTLTHLLDVYLDREARK